MKENVSGCFFLNTVYTRHANAQHKHCNELISVYNKYKNITKMTNN